MKDTWNPTQYDLFRTQRQAPFFDLLALLKGEAPIARVVDLGCGTGELTRSLHRYLNGLEPGDTEGQHGDRPGHILVRTLGIDRSELMLASAPRNEPGLEFRRGSLEDWSDDNRVDLIFSHAALQWCDNHGDLVARLLQSLKPGGQLAIQMPANHDHASHRVAAQVAQEEPFRSNLRGYVRKSPVLAIEDYALLLHEHGIQQVTCLQKVYGHLLHSSRDVVEWVQGTLLTDYEARLSADLFAQFIARYAECLVANLGTRAPYFYAFKRILLHGVKGA